MPDEPVEMSQEKRHRHTGILPAESKPALTVVITLKRQRQRCELALQSVLAQSVLPSLEVLLVDAGHESYPPILGADHPNVRVVPISATPGYGEALVAGVLQSRAPIVAFLEEHVQVFPGWGEAIVAAHKGPWAAVGPEIHAAGLGNFSCRLVELVSRGHWSAPARHGESDLLRWQNVSYKRASLMRYADHLPLFLQSEGLLFQRLRDDGERLFIEPAAKALHAHETSWFDFLSGSFYSHRLATGTIVELERAAWTRKFAGAVAGPIRWPLLLLARTRSLPERAVWHRRFWAYLPFVLQYYATAAAGSLIGLCFGVGGSDRKFLDSEINSTRAVASPPN